jgi:REP element-mobilizing transposase RayT
MSQSLAQIYIHLVFSTKERRPLLVDKDLRVKTHAYLAGILNHQECPAIVVGGVEDHVHALFRLSKSVELSNLIREVKRDSSSWVKQEGGLKVFQWQAGYGAFSVSPSHVDPLRAYINDQENHHRRDVSG